VPLFDFTCRGCGHTFEALVRSQDPAPACPSCRSADLERLTSGFAVSSAERRQAAAAASVKKQAVEGRQKNAALEREAERHRREDH
jgi:putative FmdB family regulatory protein